MGDRDLRERPAVRPIAAVAWCLTRQLYPTVESGAEAYSPAFNACSSTGTQAKGA
jgi:hypothetical protein